MSVCRLFGVCESVSCERRRFSRSTRRSALCASSYFTLSRRATSS